MYKRQAVLTGHAAGLTAHSADNVAQLTVIHVHHALPDHFTGVNVQRVALMNVVVDQQMCIRDSTGRDLKVISRFPVLIVKVMLKST